MVASVGKWPCLQIFLQFFVASIITLAFLFSSDAIVIIDKKGEKLPEVIGPMNEGSHLSLVCETDGEPSIVTWWKGTYLLDDSFITMPQGVVRNELMLSSLHRNDYMTAFTCQAALPNITQPTEVSISVDLNCFFKLLQIWLCSFCEIICQSKWIWKCEYQNFCDMKPLDVRITTLQRPLSTGRVSKLVCQSRGSKPPAILTWWLGSRQLLDAKNTSFDNVSSSTLYFVPSIEDNQKVLSCRATNPVLDGSILEDHWKLNVYYVPQVIVTVGTPNPLIKEGDDVYFDCNVQANPSEIQVGWKFNDETLYSDLSSGVKVNNRSLLLRQVTKRKTGNYSCVAANVEGEGFSESVYIDVHYLPLCKTNSKVSFGVPLNEPIEIKCVVEANPDDVVFEWYMNNSITQFPLKHFTTNGTESSVMFIPKRRTDYGYLYCRAQNRIGHQKEPCCYQITSASVPSAVENCLVTNESLTTVQVSCEPGFNGGLLQKFHLELYSSKGLHAAVADLETPTFEFNDLMSGFSYIVVVFATNSYGRSNAVALTARTQPYHKEQKDAKPVIITPILGVLIAVISSLVFVGILIVIGVHRKSSDDDEDITNSPHSQQYQPEVGTSIGEMKPGQYI